MRTYLIISLICFVLVLSLGFFPFGQSNWVGLFAIIVMLGCLWFIYYGVTHCKEAKGQEATIDPIAIPADAAVALPNQIIGRIMAQGFEPLELKENDLPCKMELYVREVDNWYECVMLIDTGRFIRRIEEEYGDCFWETLSEAHPDAEDKNVGMFCFLSTTKENKVFTDMLSFGVEVIPRHPYRLRVMAGVAKEDAKLYVSQGKGLFGVGLYKEAVARLDDFLKVATKDLCKGEIAR